MLAFVNPGFHRETLAGEFTLSHMASGHDLILAVFRQQLIDMGMFRTLAAKCSGVLMHRMHETCRGVLVQSWAARRPLAKLGRLQRARAELRPQHRTQAL
jgi:hypothetical protein